MREREQKRNLVVFVWLGKVSTEVWKHEMCVLKISLVEKETEREGRIEFAGGEFQR